MLEPLVKSLAQLEEPDIIRFKQIYNEYKDLAYKEKLWAAAAIMHNGCSDDGFIDFRAWLIAQGKDVYLSALADPDSLSEVAAVQAFGREVLELEYMPDNGYHNAADFESMSYAAGDAYKKKLGNDADIYGLLDKFLLTEQEKADITGEIIYAADIDKKWMGHGRPWLETLAELKKRCPKLYTLFNGKETPELDPTVSQKPTEKESVLEKIRQGKQQTDQYKTRRKKHSKSGPEL